jgi:hypothetical protein
MSQAPASVMRLPQHGGTHPIEPGFPSFSHQYEEGVPQGQSSFRAFWAVFLRLTERLKLNERPHEKHFSPSMASN